jgi:cell division protein FtsW (lipid II flippase)
MEYAAALALLAVPLWWRSRAARFCLVFCAVAWFFMASTRDAGASLHHTVLLWPFPQLFVAVVISSFRWKWLAAAVCIFLVAGNLLVVNQYIAQFERNGADGPFSDAIYPLSSALSEVPGQTVYVLDWGIQFPLDVLHDGHLHMVSGHDPFMEDNFSDWGKGAAARMFADRRAVFVAHTEKRENFVGVRKRFDQAASIVGCHEDSLETVPDSNGRPVFEVFKIACEPKDR